MKRLVLLIVALFFVFSTTVMAADKPAAAPAGKAAAPAVKAKPAKAKPEKAVAAAPAKLKCTKPIKIGLIGDYSGPLAVYGVMQLRSFMLGMEYMAGAPGSAGPVFDRAKDKSNTFKIDGCEITVVIGDDKGNPETTATVARELIEVQKVDMLSGTVNSGGAATLQGVAKANKKVLIVQPAASNDTTGKDFNEYTFRTSRSNYQDFINLCEYLTTKYKKFVQIAPDYSFGRGGAASARDACTKFGGTFVADDIFAPGDTKDFTPYMERILNSGADAWLVTWAGAGFVPMFKAANELGVNTKMGLGASLANNATIVIYGPMLGNASGILYHYTLPNNKINDWMVKEIKTRYNQWADLFDADGMNGAIMAVTALRKTSGSTNPEVLIKAMEGMSFDGPKGKIYVRPEDHVAIQDMYIVKILNVTDKDYKFFELLKTTRPEPPCQLPAELKSRCGKLPYGTLSGK